MPEKYTPTTDEVQLAYVDRMDFTAQARNLTSEDDSVYEAQFHCWLAKVKADAVREAAQSFRLSPLSAGDIRDQAVYSLNEYADRLEANHE